jgi:hypothetical protein
MTLYQRHPNGDSPCDFRDKLSPCDYCDDTELHFEARMKKIRASLRPLIRHLRGIELMNQDKADSLIDILTEETDFYGWEYMLIDPKNHSMIPQPFYI